MVLLIFIDRDMKEVSRLNSDRVPVVGENVYLASKGGYIVRSVIANYCLLEKVSYMIILSEEDWRKELVAKLEEGTNYSVIGEFVKIRSSTLVAMGEIGTQINLTYKCECGKVFHSIYIKREEKDDSIVTCPFCEKKGKFTEVESLEWDE